MPTEPPPCPGDCRHLAFDSGGWWCRRLNTGENLGPDTPADPSESSCYEPETDQPE